MTKTLSDRAALRAATTAAVATSLTEWQDEEIRALVLWLGAIRVEIEREVRMANASPCAGPIKQALANLENAEACLRLAAILRDNPAAMSGKDFDDAPTTY